MENCKKFYRETIATNHKKALNKASKLSNYNVNPFLVNYLANFLCGDSSPISKAKALLYPRILGTSITTSFGQNIQKMISTLFNGVLGSSTSGIDIEFTDAIDGRKKYCQLKAGPNTINKDDVETIKSHFQSVRNLARTNNLKVQLDDLVLGVLYGTKDDTSEFYKVIEQDYTVFVGKELWYHITGDKDFYESLISAITEVTSEVNCSSVLEKAVNALAEEIKESEDA